MEDKSITIPVPDAPEVKTVVERPEQAMDHVLAHEQRITQIEERHAREIQDLVQRIDDTRAELFTAVQQARTTEIQTLEGKLSRMEQTLSRLEAATVEVPQQTLEDISQAPTEAVNLVPEVESVPHPPTPKGLRARRKDRHKR